MLQQHDPSKSLQQGSRSVAEQVAGTAPVARAAAVPPQRMISAGSSAQQVVQRVPIQVKIDGRILPADFDQYESLVKIPIGSKALFIHQSKHFKRGENNVFVLTNEDYLPFIRNWLGGSLMLYRGVNSEHAVYDQAKLGLTPAKPGASSDIPAFTSDSSSTRFIPYSTSRDIAVMASKTNPREDANHDLGQEAAGPDAEVGVLVRIQVGTSHSIAIFSIGEIQVLDPPQGLAIPVTGRSLQYGNRLDRGPLDDATIIHHLQERLSDPVWNNLGKGLLGPKVPDGIKKMREALATGDWRTALRIAEEKTRTRDKDRHPMVEELYNTLTQQITRKVNRN